MGEGEGSGVGEWSGVGGWQWSGVHVLVLCIHLNSPGPFSIHCYRQKELPDAIVGHNEGPRWLN